MEVNKYISKKVLIYICLIIVILIIIRIIYTTFYFNVENFAINNEDATDLLTKIKSYNVQKGINLNSSDLEMKIPYWTNYFYNLRNPSNLVKPLAFYKPILTINNNNYAKLGDIISINNDYSLPKDTQFTILLKKNSSDIKIPLNFDLIVNTNTNTNINTNTNTNSNSNSDSNSNLNSNYLQYINGLDNTVLDNISNNLLTCSTTIDDLDFLIQNNMSDLNTNFSNMIYTNGLITIDNKKIPIIRFLNNIKKNSTSNLSKDDSGNDNSLFESIIKIDKEIEKIIEGFEDDYTDFLPDINKSLSTNITKSNTQNPNSNNNSINYEINSNSVLILPAGIQGYIRYTDNSNSDKTIDISIPANLDSLQGKSNIINNLSFKPYDNITSDNIKIITYPSQDQSLFSYISTTKVINYVRTLCTDIKNIYSQKNISSLLSYLKLAPNIEIVKSILTIIDIYLKKKNINNLTIQDFLNDLKKANINIDDTSNLLGLIIYIIKKMTLTYNLTYISFKPSDIDIVSNAKMQITITSFNNDIVSNIPESKYSILDNTEYIPLISNILPNITKFLQFITNSSGSYSAGASDNSKILPPICIYKPIAPDGYLSLGHVFCKSEDELEHIIKSKNVACVPSNCVKEIRDWIINDKVFEYNSDDTYWAIYLNPYTGTFISSNTKGQLPEGKLCKVVACVTKNNTVDKLKKADDCIRKYYNINKQAAYNSPISSKLVSDQEEVFYLEKIKSQSDSIARLQQRSKQMQTDIDKSTIVNREMNKHKLQDYTDIQKRNMDIIMKRLSDDKNKIQTNINIPLETLNDLINIINNLPAEQQKPLIDLLDSNNIITKPELDQIKNACPQYDLSGLIKKQMASDVCYGCDVPR